MPLENSNTIKQLKTEMFTRFGINSNQVRIVRSPYRICPLGAHIDHQLGPVTAMAIDRAVFLAYSPSENTEINLESLTFEGDVHFDLQEVSPCENGDWGNFPRGAVQALQKNHTLKQGIVGITAGRMGEGGLSSSAAIGVAYLLALEDVNELTVTSRENIRLDQAIENEYLGLKNGILDQSAILLARRNHLTLINCKNNSHTSFPKPEKMEPFAILITFSGIRQALVSTGYNTRVTECAEAASILLKANGRICNKPLLGQLSAEEYADHKSLLAGPIAKRAKHFFSEKKRVCLGVQAWISGDLQTFGRLIFESGHSSIHNYECGSQPLIDLYDILKQTEGVLGARFSGGGFRGCCIALVDPERAEEISRSVMLHYALKQPSLASDAQTIICKTDNGARIL